MLPVRPDTSAQFRFSKVIATTAPLLIAYTQGLLADAWPALESLGCRVEPANGSIGRCHHLVGLWLPDHADPMIVSQALQAENISVSARARVLRIAPHLYNTPDDVDALVGVLAGVLK